MTRPTTGLGSGRPHPWVKVARFLSKIEQRPEGCWGWTGSVSPNGYARYGIMYAHRLAYELLVGPIPDGMDIDHVRERGCTERTCTNPDHLEVVTPAENRRRQPNVIDQMARTHCPKGHPYDQENTRMRGNKRGCRQCDRDSAARIKKGLR
jgi:hypothetical protein